MAGLKRIVFLLGVSLLLMGSGHAVFAQPMLAATSTPAAGAVPVLQATGLHAISHVVLELTGFGCAGCSARQAAWSPDARVLALEMNCVEAGQGRRFWLLDLAQGEAVAASPPLGPPDLQRETASATGADLYWSGQTLLVFTSGHDDTREPGSPGASRPISFVASLGPVHKAGIVGVSAALKQRRREMAAARDAAQALGDEGLLAATVLPLGQHLVWLSDRGGGEIVLRSKRMDPDGGVRDLQRGGWELQYLLHDDTHLVHASEAGLMMVDLDSGAARHIEGTARGDLPLAWNADTRSLAWSSPRPCGPPGGSTALGLQLCTAVLDAVN